MRIVTLAAFTAAAALGLAGCQQAAKTDAKAEAAQAGDHAEVAAKEAGAAIVDAAQATAAAGSDAAAEVKEGADNATTTANENSAASDNTADGAPAEKK